MSMVNRSFLSALVVMSFAMSAATSGQAQEGKKKFMIPLNADTRDVHFENKTPITGVTVTPAPDSSQAQGTNRRSLGWNTAPGAGKREFEVTRDGNGAWKLKFWLTTDGITTTFPSTPPTGQLAALFVAINDGLVSVFGENDGPSDVFVTNVSAALVVDLDSFFDPNWSDATGANVFLPDLLLPAGSDMLLFGDPFPLDDASWIKLTADFDGDEQVYGETVAVPEPSTLALFSIAVLGLLGYGWRNRKLAAI